MKISSYKSYDELPLFLNADLVAKVLGVSPSRGYELMHEPDFPVLKVGSRNDNSHSKPQLQTMKPPVSRCGPVCAHPMGQVAPVHLREAKTRC